MINLGSTQAADEAATERVRLNLLINGRAVAIEALPDERLIDVLRNRLRLTGTKEGCGIGECGACTVLLDGKAVNACLVLAAQAEGRQIQTIEGVGDPDGLHPLQQAFIDQHAVQCGYCTPGMVLSGLALLRENPHPTENEVRTAISGNLCRCTGYGVIVKAILTAAERMTTDPDRSRPADEP